MSSKIIFGIILALVFSPRAVKAQTESHVSLVNGSELYANCQSYEHNVTYDGADKFVFNGSDEEKMQSEQCMSYIEGVVDSLPAGNDFHPNAGVRLSQYVDVVFHYLDAHPESRDNPAFALCRTALTNAFGGKARAS